MSNYSVRIRETLKRVVNVEANGMAEAKQVAADGKGTQENADCLR